MIKCPILVDNFGKAQNKLKWKWCYWNYT